MQDELIRQWKDIAAHLHVSVDAAQDYAKRNEDPLPIYVDHRGVCIEATALRDWVARQRMAYVKHLVYRKAARSGKKRRRSPNAGNVKAQR
jgi:hypothetical protein